MDQFENINNLPSSILIKNIPLAIYSCDIQGYIVAYSPAAALLWGREPEIGKEKWCGAYKLYKTDLSPVDWDIDPLEKALKTGVVEDMPELILERPDGTFRNILPSLALLYDDAHNVVGAINTIVDITQKKNIEKEQAMLISLVESSEDAIISKTLTGEITGWNDSASKLFGYDKAEVIGQQITMLMPEERLDEEVIIINKIRAGERIAHFETYRKAKDGTEVPISLTISPIKDNNGMIIGASKIARDISRQKHSEYRLQRYAENLEILNSFGQMISENMDINDILQKVSDATTQLTRANFGIFFYNKTSTKTETQVLYSISGTSEKMFDTITASSFSTIFNDYNIIRSDDVTQDKQYLNTIPNSLLNDPFRIMSYLAIPVISKSGNIIGGLVYGHYLPAQFTEEHELLVSNIAAQAAVALDNAKLYDEIKDLNNKKDEFIGLASHELKTPLTSLNGYLQILERSLDQDDKNKILAIKARNQVGKLVTLISDLLDVTKIQTGELPFSYTEFDLIELLNEVIDIMSQMLPMHQIDVDLHTDSLLIKADQQRIEQVINNLISNAAKYSPNADRIIIRSGVENNEVYVSVRDFGIGIDKKQHQDIFSRFYRVENHETHISGLGIGLYICNEIIRRHKGRFTVDSELGKGATFTFKIPIKN